MSSSDPNLRGSARREFLWQCSAAVASGLAVGAAASAGDQPAAGELPTIQLGKHRVSRMIAGWNPIGGYSYMGHHMDQHMREYYTPERTVEFLQGCEQQGVNTHQYSPSDKSTEVLRAMRERGSKMQFLCLSSGRAQVKATIEATAPFAIAHHGGATDTMFAAGKSGEVHDFVKEVHDRGLLAGVSAHNPDCIRRVADEGWEVDFFMTCFYFLTRMNIPEAREKAQPDPTLPVGSYAFYRDDPTVMTEVVRQVKKPCFGFKILGSGRKCGSQQSVRQAFQFAFERIKPTDGLIVGMYPRFFDEIRANAEYVREFGKTS
ncbi:MAG: hypothetical protein PHO07_08340 [Pirellulales bacterium]|jgi:hypothetical protein|nr:hypothetical protein [Thermoguttaceae bacterium]MDD4787166.1 hypothetical protein [Pirellulales bacterium]MDI9444141.1 hypothetical protein [Planctomycetota bacterium]NLY98978.1 hypothetical protein [Pirellulaceae bacterium]